MGHISKRNWQGWIAALLLAGYAVFVGMNHAPVAAGADSGGYLGSARLLTEGHFTTPMRTVPEFPTKDRWANTPLGYERIGSEDRLKPTYPIGLPLHYALAGALGGWHWGILFMGVGATVAGVVGCYVLLRHFHVDRWLSGVGAALLAISPIYLFVAFVPMSDVYATVWCLVAFLLALKSRGSAACAVAAGAAFAMAVLVRPANAIFFPVLVLLIWNWRALLLALLGGLPGAVLNGLYNRALYGSPFVSGYGASIFDNFHSSYVQGSLQNYLSTLKLAFPIILCLPIGLAFARWRRDSRELAACVMWIVIFFGFYAFYLFTQQTWWFLRFVLPAFPAVILITMVGVHALIERAPGSSRKWISAVVGVALVAVSFWGARRIALEHHLMLMKPYQQPYVAVTDWAKKNLPANAVIGSMQTSSAFYFYTDFPILRWDVIEPAAHAEFIEAIRRTGRPYYVVLFPFEKPDAFDGGKLPGHWDKIAEVKEVGIWKFDPSK